MRVREKSVRVPLHRRVTAQLLADVQPHLHPGRRLESESQLANKYGVSVRTIREALSTLVGQGWVERRHGVGTFVARRSTPRPVGLWMDTNPEYPLAIFGLRVLNRTHELLVNHGWRVKTYLAHAGQEQLAQDATYRELLEDLAAQRLSGFVHVQGCVGLEARQRLEQTGIPVVGSTEQPLVPSAGWVASNIDDMVRNAVGYLLEQGCRRIAFMSWLLPGFVNAARDLFVALLQHHGAAVYDQWIRGDLHPSLAGAGYAEFREIWASRAEKPDGLFVADDMLFSDVVTAILELGINVPQQLRVVAHANKGMVACPFLPAARLEFDADEHAQALADLMTKRLRGEPVAMPQVILRCRWREPAVATAGSEINVVTQTVV